MNNEKVRNEILAMLGIKPDKWFDVFTDSGVEAIKMLSDGMVEMEEMLKDTAAYWNWYADQFTIIDKKFISNYRYQGNDGELKETLIKLWIDAHKVGMQNIQIPGAVIKANAHREGVEL